MRPCILVLLLFILSCHKETHEQSPGSDVVEAIILYTGDVPTDGCGWMVVTNSSEHYHPDSLPDSVKQNGLAVLVNFTKTTDNFNCGNGATASVIHILSIKPI